MSSLDTKMSQIAEQVLKRPLTEDEQLEIYKISDVMGMANVQSFLYQLLVFKLHEDTMKTQFGELARFESRLNEKFEAMAALESKIHETLENSVERILGEGARRIGEDMGDTIADRAEHVLTAVAEYHSIRGQTIIICFICIITSLAYWLGSGNVLKWLPAGGPLEALLFLPAGWCVFLCGVTYTFFWIGDHWKRIKRTMLCKTLLGLQLFSLAWLANLLL